MSFSTTTIPDECCTKTCLNPFLSLHNFFTFIIVLLHIVSTVLQYMNTVYTNVDPACITDCGFQIIIIIIIIILVSVPNGTHDGRINCEHVCVRVGERNEKKKSLVVKIKFKKSTK